MKDQKLKPIDKIIPEWFQEFAKKYNIFFDTTDYNKVVDDIFENRGDNG